MEKYALLPKGDYDGDNEERAQDIVVPDLNHFSSATRKRSWLVAYLVLSHTLLIMALVGLWTLRQRTLHHHPSDTFDIWEPFPVSSLISTEHATGHKQSIYSGQPDEENTKAWEKLIDPTFIAASESELRAANESVHDSVVLADAEGYLAALGVYHELHCLRRIRMYLFRDYYFDDLTEANMDWFRHHLDHCIETLRISIMCSADLSLYTFRWQDLEDVRPETKTNAKRQCANWDEVEQWSQERNVGLSPRLLKGGKADKTPL